MERADNHVMVEPRSRLTPNTTYAIRQERSAARELSVANDEHVSHVLNNLRRLLHNQGEATAEHGRKAAAKESGTKTSDIIDFTVGPTVYPKLPNPLDFVAGANNQIVISGENSRLNPADLLKEFAEENASLLKLREVTLFSSSQCFVLCVTPSTKYSTGKKRLSHCS
jgi:hypothetical protein